MVLISVVSSPTAFGQFRSLSANASARETRHLASNFLPLAMQARRRMRMGHSQYDPVDDRTAWNSGRKLGAKRPLKPQQIWEIRFLLDREKRVRDRALFDLAIDSKLRGCDLVKVRIGELVSGGRVRNRQSSSNRRQGSRFSSNCWNRRGLACTHGWSAGAEPWMTMPFRAGLIILTISALDNMHA